MKNTILFFLICFALIDIKCVKAEEINDHCSKFGGVLVCGIKEKEIKETPKIETPKKNDDVIIKTSWEQEEKEYSDQEICDAIWFVEGQENANQFYGINPQYTKCENRLECYQICINTVKNNKIRFKNQNKEKDFYTFLAKRYCPYNWKIWLKNLNFYLTK